MGPQAPTTAVEATPQVPPQETKRKITAKELAEHNESGKSLWVALYGEVYDLTEYAEEHPGGVEAITDTAGMDGTEKFEAVHNRELLDSMGFEPVGVLATEV